MKKLIKLLLIATAVFLIVRSIPLESYLYYSYCDDPITYKLGRVDPAFKITSKEVEQELQAAGSVWNSAYAQPLVVYDPQSSFSINLVYDERQRNLTKLYQAKDKVEKESAVIEASLKQYETNAARLTAKVNELNKEISDWNAKGGAPKEDYRRLTQEAAQVNSEIAQLAKQRQEADKKILYYNDLINQYNLQVAQYADIMKTLPEEGLYDPLADKIDIYFYDSAEQFLHTATHEFGHAIGLSHTQDENSIMYPISNSTTQLSKEDLNLLANYCQHRSVIEELVKRSRDIISKLKLS